MELKYWNLAIERSAVPCRNGAWGIYDTSHAPRVIAAHQEVSRVANWYPEHDRLLWEFVVNRDVKSIREWAEEMRTEMPDDKWFPVELCENIADAMDRLASMIE